MLVCAIAVMLPTAIETTAMTVSICCQSATSAPNPSTKKRMQIAKAANFGAAPNKSVTEVGAP